MLGKSWVRSWLLLGLIMIFCQIVIGGITRLTGSGLSITRWEIVIGTVPPIGSGAWDEAFMLYKATPQYEKLNRGMTLREFKVIYFWEYIHRLWARLMGLVFVIPLLILKGRGWIDRWLGRRLLIVFLLAGAAALFGWLMVASGLIDRPWVSAYRLTVHLGLGVSLLLYLFWTILMFDGKVQGVFALDWVTWLVIAVVTLQMILGGLMAGMRAALLFPDWPGYRGEWLPSLLLSGEMWHGVTWLAYDESAVIPTMVHVLHRLNGYLCFFVVIFWGHGFWKGRNGMSRFVGVAVVSGVILQVLVGILTLVGSKGAVPVGLGVAHQGVAMILCGAVLAGVFVRRHLRFADNRDTRVMKEV